MKYHEMVKKVLVIGVAVILVICSAACSSKSNTSDVNEGNTNQNAYLNSISLKDSDFIGKWKIVDLTEEELEEDFFGEDIIIVKKDETIKIGDFTSPLSNFHFLPGIKEKGVYSYTASDNNYVRDYNSGTIFDYGTLFCDYSHNGREWQIELDWENEKHTEATLKMFGSTASIKKK